MRGRFGRGLLFVGFWAVGANALLPGCGGTTLFGAGGGETGCQKDTDCKGARVCMGGMCVDPGAGGSSSGPSSSHGVTATSSSGIAGTTATSGSGGSGTASASAGSGGAATASASATTGSGGKAGTSSSTGGSCSAGDPNVDHDGDGWTAAQGDCNDCDPTVNPGAVDVPGDPAQVDHDCDGKYDPPAPCDGNMALDDVSADDAAKVIELCQVTTETAPLPQKTWGVLSSQYVRADGTPYATPGLQVGIQTAFGASVNPQAGQSMLALSSGFARTTSQMGACGSTSCSVNATGKAPPGFPQNVPSCPPVSVIADDIGLQVQLRTPTNATGYSFSFKFYSEEFPYWICTSYADQFVALASPAPAGAINGNIAFGPMNVPVGAMIPFMTVCDPTQVASYGSGCMGGGTMCPSAPSPYCPDGTTQLQGTGFEVWDSMYGGAGATPWLSTVAPVQGGSEVTLRFAIWDGGDTNFDSTTLIDDFQWITGGTAVSVGTAPIPNPK